MAYKRLEQCLLVCDILLSLLQHSRQQYHPFIPLIHKDAVLARSFLHTFSVLGDVHYIFVYSGIKFHMHAIAVNDPYLEAIC